ncbi:hypothetical protein FRC04_008416 [Tulasnella sp. 424]|nr:hypothetical protein FRC04_008416 [Tulasnella sp. 424]KAG8976787.1 hypothetical protein FRC05_003137 [Tulasnella sp. 425]
MPSEHPKYGDATYLVFLVEDILFHVPLRRLKQSQYFRDMIEETHTGLESEGKSNEHPIFLSGISAFEMTSFLDALDSSFLSGDPKLEFAQWAAALHLATMWSFDDVREMIITHMDKTIETADPFDRIDASLKCRVEKWLHPAYQAICQRAEGLKDEEAERLGLRRSAAIWRIRESLEPVEDTIFHLPLRRLKQSQYFRGMIDGAHTGLEAEGNSDEKPILLRGISASEMASFLNATDASFLDGDPHLTFNQWAAALHLATMWGFDNIRKKIIMQMDGTISEVDPLDRIDASLKCRVRKWLYPAYEVLCRRVEGLSNDEAERLGRQRSAAIRRIREALLSPKTSTLGRKMFDVFVGNDPGENYLRRQDVTWRRQDANWREATSLDVMSMIEREEALRYS